MPSVSGAGPAASLNVALQGKAKGVRVGLEPEEETFDDYGHGRGS